MSHKCVSNVPWSCLKIQTLFLLEIPAGVPKFPPCVKLLCPVLSNPQCIPTDPSLGELMDRCINEDQPNV